MAEGTTATQDAATAESPVALDDVTALALRLSPLDRVRLIERLLPAVEQDIQAAAPAPSRSLYGALAHLGPAPSEEDIAEMRREAWGRFGDEDNLDG